ncbi:MAG TPA: hypothetical protein DEO84_07895 [candidate division Zixibacteria bacterium]|nr:hypothetical protein [candidate division Zixibacteria bacterium]HBZ01222.1 hypothetical protein [candidate division Zixibacteria bacterium]
MKKIWIVICLLTALLASVVWANDSLLYPADVLQALDKAGDNRPELEKVLSHYQADNDSLKLKAAYYLIGNMEGHSYMLFGLYDSTKAEVSFNVLDYPTYDSLLAAFDKIEAVHPGLDFDKKENKEDLKAIKAEFLIKQIDLAFQAWYEKPWAKGLTFDQFCEYVLPYRGSNEPLEDWRDMFYEKYKGLESKMANPSDPTEAAKLINNDVKTYFTFDPRFYYHPTDEGLGEMLSLHLGRCEDMTNIAIYAMRANALAVTSDYTPFWANSGNNHAWNAILNASGKVVPFMGAEANPGEYKLWNKLAKVYRKTYSQQKGNLIFQDRKQKKVPGWLAGKSYIDVTSDYVNTCDVAVTLDEPTPDSVDIAYICVFNDGEWQAIQWGRIKDGQVTFAGMGADIAYLPAFYENDKIVPAGAPFILSTDCKIQKLSPAENQTNSVQLMSTTNKVLAVSTDGVAQAAFTPAKEYELFYWKSGWQSLGKTTASDKPLLFDSVPTGYLYWLVETSSNKEERIFTIDPSGKQVWW